jgi:hypothetical protein
MSTIATKDAGFGYIGVGDAIAASYGLLLECVLRVSQERDRIHEKSSHLIFAFSCWCTLTLMWDVLCGVVGDVISCIILFMIL